MASMTLCAPWTMATTRLMSAVDYENAVAGQPETLAARNSLRMNWVVDTDGDGASRLCMSWSCEP